MYVSQRRQYIFFKSFKCGPTEQLCVCNQCSAQTITDFVFSIFILSCFSFSWALLNTGYFSSFSCFMFVRAFPQALNPLLTSSTWKITSPFLIFWFKKKPGQSAQQAPFLSSGFIRTLSHYIHTSRIISSTRTDNECRKWIKQTLLLRFFFFPSSSSQLLCSDASYVFFLQGEAERAPSGEAEVGGEDHGSV